jgi:deoxyribonuclease-4
VQVFTKNQRQWKVKPLEEEELRLWFEHQKKTRVKPAVSHDSYLINLASPDAAARKRSIALFREELIRCEALEIPFLVAHPGAHMGSGEEKGLKQIARSLDQVHRDLPGLKVLTCLEVTAGQGSGLGYRFEHLRDIIAMCRQPERLATCMDTAHMLEAGYDLRNAKGAAATLQELDDVVGLKQVKVWHVNDSKTPRGSRVDRHAHIGKGHIAQTAFATIVSHPAVRKVPKIMETPKEDAPDGRPWDEINLKKLRGMAGQKRRRGEKKARRHVGTKRRER